MGQLEKLIAEFKACTGPFPYRDLQRLLGGLGYIEKTGKGSGRRFHHPDTGHVIRFHEPHPANTILPYLVRQIRAALEEKGMI